MVQDDMERNDFSRLTALINMTFRIFDSMCNLARDRAGIVLKWSGGKDSTLLIILFINWIMKRRIDKYTKIFIIYNDTLGEIPFVEKKTYEGLQLIRESVKSSGLDIGIVVTYPEKHFFTYVVERGYPCPNVRFRWCTRYLKLEPTYAFFEKLVVEEGIRIIITLTGEHIEESKFRDRKLNNLLNRGIMSLPHEVYKVPRTQVQEFVIHPLILWTTNDVFSLYSLLEETSGKAVSVGIENIFRDLEWLWAIYKLNPRARLGCWFCTLASKVYEEALMKAKYIDTENAKIYDTMLNIRRLYERFSRDPNYRELSTKKRFKLGPLTMEARETIVRELLKLPNDYRKTHKLLI